MSGSGIKCKLYPLGNAIRESGVDSLVYTIDTTKYSSSNAVGYAPFTTGTYTSLAEETINIDWGDNSNTLITDGVISSTTNTHTYSSPGTYQIKITSTGDFPTINFVDGFGSSYTKILKSVDSVLPYCVTTTGNAVTSFIRCFYNCTSLTTIPSGLFDNNVAVTDFSYCFLNCSGLTSIPSGLFDNNTLVTTFSYCFFNCTNLTTIPSGLFDNNTAVTSFSRCFYNCTSLTTIPSGLFDNNTSVTTFSDCFYNCTNLTTIPSGLFDNNTLVTTFSYCFYNCTNLTTIPSGLFDNNTAVTNFSSCFGRCTSLTTIPSGLFDNNVAVTDFSSCFSICTNLTSIPQYVFKYNTAVTRFNACFHYCFKLQLNVNIFCDEATEMTTRFANVTPDFRYCFYTDTASFTGTQGTAPQLWNYTYFGTPTSTYCFTGHSTTSLTNYSSIPSAWGGPA